jgi:TetR/AcrR family transcriptional regulator, regulator of cefoperazone and chloramphenicol sensitivity
VNADRETRDRLLKAGARLFGAHGFREVTVREICRAAEANVAAVNYHFGDKLGLYRELLQQAIGAMRGVTEAAREAGRGQPPDEQLRRYLKVFLRAILSPEGAAIHRLIAREMSDPTPALDDIVEQGIRPRVEYLSGVVARLIPCDRDDPRVLRCVGSIYGQQAVYMPNPIRDRLGLRFEATPQRIDEAAEHIARFSVAGVRAVGDASGRGRRPRPARKARGRARRHRSA